MKYVAATYVTETITARCGASSTTGTGIPSGKCILHPTRHYGSRWLNGSDYGKLVPCEQRDAMMLASGHIQELRRPRETGLYFFRGPNYSRKNHLKKYGYELLTAQPAPMRRSWRKAVRNGFLTLSTIRTAQYKLAK